MYRQRSLCVRVWVLCACLCSSAVAGEWLDPANVLTFGIEEGRNLNRFVRDADVAAHCILRAGKSPRLIVAFPAGNSGIGLWFARSENDVVWQIAGAPRPVRSADSQGRPLRGIEVEIETNVHALSVAQALLSSVRVLRDYEASGAAPAEVQVAPQVTSSGITWARDRLDGAAGYRLSLEVVAGRIEAAERIAQSSSSGDATASGGLRFKVVALTGEMPLRPLTREMLLRAEAARDAHLQDALEFLSYEEKFLAGSWRFNTYFGRDTLISLALLAPVLQPHATESGIGSVLSRLDAAGEVAHEEEIGEFALLRSEKRERRSAAPIYDYSMIDEDFLLAPVAATYLLDSADAFERAPMFLARRMSSGERQGDALVRNLLWIVKRTAPFARGPSFRNLIALKEGRAAGEWRDSEDGLGGGRYPYDVNVVLAPAALASTERLITSGLLDEYLSGPQRQLLARAGSQHQVWARRVAALFRIEVPRDEALARVAAFARTVRVDEQAALASMGTRTIGFNAVALDSDGMPIPIMHSDEGFGLLFDLPPPQVLERQIGFMTRPFPAGLLTPIGLLIANPAFASPALQARFGSSAYHGTVVWSWQQAMLVAGIQRQLARHDLPKYVRDRLLAARVQLWSAIDNARTLRASELWSWSYSHGAYRVEPFGQRGSDVDESNAVQLWSTVYLAIYPR